MIGYNPKDWFLFIFRFHKSDTLRILYPLIIGICFYCWLLAYLLLEVFDNSDNTYLKNINIVHTLLSFVISTLLVFRTNSAYDRWWEGRKVWGQLVNVSRNFAIQLNAILPATDKDNRMFFVRLIGFYMQELVNHLQDKKVMNELIIDNYYEFSDINMSKHKPNQVASLMYRKIQKMYKESKISGEQLIILDKQLNTYTDCCGMCERIKNTPIPYSYSVFLKKFIFFYVMTLPLSLVFTLGYYSIPVVGFIFYVLASLELIAEEIEDPFDGDDNDLPIKNIAKNIKHHVSEILIH